MQTPKRFGTRVLKATGWDEARAGGDAGSKLLADEVFSYRYDDLLGPATAINVSGAGTDPAAADDGGWEFSASQTNTLILIQQLPHNWVEGTDIEPHFHWEQQASGDVLWRLQYIWYNNGNAVPAWSTAIDVTSAIFPYTSGTIGQLTSFGNIDGSGKTISSILKLKISRIGGDSSDTMNAVATITSCDSHALFQGFGSERQYIKRI